VAGLKLDDEMAATRLSPDKTTGDPLLDALMADDEAGARGLIGASSALDGQAQAAAVHVAVAYDRVWALPLLREAGADLSQMLHCGQEEDNEGEGEVIVLSDRDVSAHLCMLLRNATTSAGTSGMPWWDRSSASAGGIEQQLHAPAAVHPMYTATMCGSLSALQFLTTRGILDTSQPGEKTALFEPFIYRMHYFTKTGSGQT
jgi:hypothetical protein